MTVLFLYQDIDSGAKLSTEAIITALKKYYPQDTYIAYKQPPNHFRGPFSYLRNFCWSVYDYRKVISNEEVDIIYSVMFTSALSHRLSKKRKYPFIFHFHGDQKFGEFKGTNSFINFFKYPYFKLLNQGIIFLQTLAVKTSKKVIFVSKESAREIVQKYHLNSNLFTYIVIENGVDQSFFKPVTIQKKLNIKRRLLKTDKTIISYLGRIDEKKGLINLVKAFSLLKRLDTKLLIAFPKPLDSFSVNHLNQIKFEIKRLQLKTRIVLIEGRKELASIFQISDLVVLPSTQEMFPLVMLESLASGVLFLSTQVGGVSSVLTLISKKLLMKDNQPETIAFHINQLMTLEKKEHKMLVSKAKEVISIYTWENTSKKIHKVFNQTYIKSLHR